MQSLRFRMILKIVLVLVLHICIFLPDRSISASRCPCIFPGFPSQTGSESTKSFKLFLRPEEKLHLCVEDSSFKELKHLEALSFHDHKVFLKEIADINVFSSVFNHSLLSMVSVSGFTDQAILVENQCNVLLSITDNPIEEEVAKRRICPDSCFPFPILQIPKTLFSFSSYHTFPYSYAISCTLTLQTEIFPRWKKLLQQQQRASSYLSQLPSWISFFLSEVALRRYYECNEFPSLYRYAFPKYLTKYLNDSITNHFPKSLVSPLSSLYHSNLSASSFSSLSSVNEITSSTSSSSKRSSSSLSYLTKPFSSISMIRKIQGMIVWIGSQEKYSLMENQHLTLLNESFHNETAILGWTATDSIYSCSPEAIKCYGNHKKYATLLPPSNINFMSSGWGCAQRRPLRVLSHILLFYHMNFLILLDDDTYFNYYLFQKKYLSLFLSSSSSITAATSSAMISRREKRFNRDEIQSEKEETFYLGEALGKTGETGHLSKEGFFVGGSGYIFNHKLLIKLVTKEVLSFGFEQLFDFKQKKKASSSVSSESLSLPHSLSHHDPYRSELHMKKLSILQEGLEYSQSFCHLYETSSEEERGGGTNKEVSQKGRNQNDKYTCIYPIELPNKFLKEMKKNDTGGISSPFPIDIADRYNRVPLSLRLIDFCSNLMANENTCQHR
jgi:hypothetical protein